MINYLKDYAQFSSVKEMDQAASKHISINFNELNETDKNVLNMIRCYSVKYGAAHLKHATIEKTLSKSNSTVRRVLKKLEDLKIIKRISTIRRITKGFGANIYVILPVEEQSEIDTRQHATKVDSPSHNEPKKEINHLSLITKDSTSSSDTYRYEMPATLYQRFKSLLANSIGKDNKTASRLYGVYRAISIRLMRFEHHKKDKELLEDLAVRAINITTQATKKKNIRNLAGYFSGVYQKLIDEVLFDDDYFNDMFSLLTH